MKENENLKSTEFRQIDLVLLANSLIMTLNTLLGPYWNYYREQFINNSRTNNFLFIALFCLSALGMITYLGKARWRPFLLAAQSISFLFLHSLTAQEGQAWNYLTHVFFSTFIALASQLPKRYCLREDDALLGIKFVVAMVYFQSVTSKLIWSGFEWFSDGNVIRTYGILFGTRAGAYLSSQPFLAQSFAFLGILLELSFGFGLLMRRTFTLTAIAIVIFHSSIFLMLGISFWHLCLIVISLVDLKVLKSCLNQISIFSGITNNTTKIRPEIVQIGTKPNQKISAFNSAKVENYKLIQTDIT